MDLDASIVCLNLRPPKALAASSTVEFPMDIGTRTDAGRVRLNNEDSLLVAPEMSLFVLSDGMGGLACGEVASRLTVETASGSLPGSGRRSDARSYWKTSRGGERDIQPVGQWNPVG